MATKAQSQFAYHQLGQTLRSLEEDLRWGLEGSVRIPPEWHAIAHEAMAPPKQQITLKLDDDVLRFFRAMGRGYSVRLNAVLRAFMLARLAEVIKAVPEYELTPADEEAQIKAELTALVKARMAARDAAEAALAAAPKTRARLAVLREGHARYRKGE